MALGVSPTFLPCVEPGAGVSRRGTSNICRRPPTLQRTAGTELIRRQLDTYRWSVGVQGSRTRPDTVPRSGFPSVEVGKDQRVRGLMHDRGSAVTAPSGRAGYRRPFDEAETHDTPHATATRECRSGHGATEVRSPCPSGAKAAHCPTPERQPPGPISLESSPRTGCRGGLQSLPLSAQSLGRVRRRRSSKRATPLALR